jgi:hypothetical protein
MKKNVNYNQQPNEKKCDKAFFFNFSILSIINLSLNNRKKWCNFFCLIFWVELLVNFWHELAQTLQMVVLEFVAHGVRFAIQIACVRIAVRSDSIYIVLFC